MRKAFVIALMLSAVGCTTQQLNLAESIPVGASAAEIHEKMGGSSSGSLLDRIRGTRYKTTSFGKDTIVHYGQVIFILTNDRLIQKIENVYGGTPRYYLFNVEALTSKFDSPKKIYLVPADARISTTDLDFIKYAGAISQSLKRAGYQVATKDSEADLIVKVRYSGQVSKETRLNAVQSAGVYTAEQTVWIDRKKESDYQLTLDAYSNQNQSVGKPVQRWKVTVIRTSADVNNLTGYMPYLASVAVQYIGVDTNGSIPHEMIIADERGSY